MTKRELIDACGFIDEKFIEEYENIKPNKNNVLFKVILPAAACIALATAVFLVPLIGHNAPDPYYEARCTRFQSSAEAEKVIGNEFLFTKIIDKDFTEITLLVAKGGDTSDKSTWEQIEYYTKGKSETIDISVFLPAFDGRLPDHVYRSDNVQTAEYGDTQIKYSIYEKGSKMSMEYNVVAAEFEFSDNIYELLYYSEESPDKAFEYLAQMLGA